jgi:ankyrin repeat protein
LDANRATGFEQHPIAPNLLQSIGDIVFCHREVFLPIEEVRHGTTPLAIACKNGHLGVVKQLLKEERKKAVQCGQISKMFLF